jgi:hypothetical protein
MAFLYHQLLSLTSTFLSDFLYFFTFSFPFFFQSRFTGSKLGANFVDRQVVALAGQMTMYILLNYEIRGRLLRFARGTNGPKTICAHICFYSVGVDTPGLICVVVLSTIGLPG